MPMKGRRGCARGSDRFCPLAFLYFYLGSACLPSHAYAYLTLFTWVIFASVHCLLYVYSIYEHCQGQKKFTLGISILVLINIYYLARTK